MFCNFFFNYENNKNTEILFLEVGHFQIVLSAKTLLILWGREVKEGEDNSSLGFSKREDFNQLF